MTYLKYSVCNFNYMEFGDVSSPLSLLALSLKLFVVNFILKLESCILLFKVKSYFRLKSFSPVYLSSNVVYYFKCMSNSCSDNYVGYTSRLLFERCDEHLNLKSTKQSEIKDPVRLCNSCKNIN